MRAAEAAAAELGNLEDEEQRRQQQRLQELLATANRQWEEAELASLAASGSITHRPPPGFRAA
jgi:hypothetical protein